MSSNNNIYRIVVATSEVWTASQLSRFLTSLDGVASRVSAICSLTEMLNKAEPYFSNLKVMGLLDKGTPEKWGITEGGSESLARSDYLKYNSLLNQYGIEVQEKNLSWNLNLKFEDVIELVSDANRLEIEFINMGSDGMISTVISSVEKFPGAIAPILNTIRYGKEQKKLWQLAVKREKENLKILKANVEQERAKAEQERENAILKKLEVQNEIIKYVSTLSSFPKLDPDKTLEKFKNNLINNGIDLKPILEKMINPINKDLDYVFKCICQGLVKAIIVDNAESSSD